jgi:hypothetical protein
VAGCSCGVLPPRWWEDADTFARVLEEHRSHRAMREAHDVALSTLSRWRQTHAGTRERPAHSRRRPGERDAVKPLGEPGVAHTDEGLELVSDVTEEQLGDVEALLEARGLDPNDWQVERVTVNEWQALAYGGGPDGEPRVVTLRQLKAHLRRKLSFALIFPARELAPLELEREVELAGGEAVTWALFSCEQAPNHDEELEALVLEWLRANRPHGWAALGDLGDYPAISRHRDNPAWFHATQACIDASAGILERRVHASPGSRRRLLEGNHDARLRYEMLTRAERMYGLKAATLAGDDDEQLEALSLRRLLRLDELGIGYIATAGGGTYEHAELELAPELVARHGWLTGPNAGSRSAQQLGRSVIVGHTHAQGIGVVMQARAGRRHRLQGMEVGCLCRTREGLGYAVNPAWSPGFGTATVLPDGRFHLELATYDPDERRLVWRDQDYRT